MSSFVVSARKYRPMRFTDVVGQEHVTQTLKNALQNDHLAHAFLFCGPRGVGKTTCARILAKVLNCQNVAAEHEPCNTCPSCETFNSNASFNITELDAASNNSVEHIRALIEQVRFQPQQGNYKVFIIDEVHMLSQQAFNAFLKTLEEPPAYAIFILATTEKHKIIPTILSRCQIYDFKRIQVSDMVGHLESICREEGIQAERSGLHIIAKKADGALRDALSIFDRIVSSGPGREITYRQVIENLNVLDYEYYFQLVDALLTEDFAQVMRTLDEIIRKGFDPDLLINGLAEHLRNLLVCQDPETIDLLEVSQDSADRYAQQAAAAPTSFLLTALNLANDCDINYRMARNKRLHVEMALIKMTYIQRAVDLSQIKHGRTALPPKKKQDPANPNDLKAAVAPTPKVSQTEKAEVPKISESAVNPEEPTPPPAATNRTPKPSGISGMPKLPSLGSIRTKIEEEQRTPAEAIPQHPLNDEHLQKAWQSYLEEVEQQSAKAILSGLIMEVKDNEIVARAGTKLAESTLRQARDLMDHLRTYFQRPDLVLTIQIDPILAPEAPKMEKPLTPKEKFQQMAQENPAVREMQQRFGLRFDED